MKDYIHKLHKMKLFSLQDVAQLTCNESTAKSLLSAGIKNGTICRVKMNLYAVTDLATMRCAANKYEIASHISDTACVAYHSAMEYHGLGHQVFNEVSVITPYAFKTFEFEGLPYIRRQPTITEGITTPLMDSKIRVTDLLQLTDGERLFIGHFNANEHCPELLFEDEEIVERVWNHPMTLWKTSILKN